MIMSETENQSNNQMPEDEEHLAKLNKMVDNALADGKLNRQEMTDIKREIYADKKVTPGEAKISRELSKQIFEGEVAMED